MNKKVLLVTVLLFLVCVAMAQGVSRPLIVAHRGGAALGVENTLSCIEAGIAAGADAVEVDVRLTKDGHLVVFHDARVDATTDGRGKISEMTLRDVKALNIVDKAGCVTGEKIPTLGGVLSLVDGRCRVLVEVKRGSGEGVEGEVLRVVREGGAAGWVSVQSFSDVVLRRFRELGAPFPLEKLVVFKVPFLPLIFDGGLSFFSLKKYDYISSFNFHKRCLPASLARKLREAGKGVKVWTVLSVDDVPSAPSDAIIVDDPRLWRGR